MIIILFDLYIMIEKKSRRFVVGRESIIIAWLSKDVSIQYGGHGGGPPAVNIHKNMVRK